MEKGLKFVDTINLNIDTITQSIEDRKLETFK